MLGVILDRFLDRGVQKRVTDNSRYIGATVTPADMAGRYSSATNRDAWAQIERARQWVEICARKNASMCTAQNLRLYVAKAAGGSPRDDEGFKTRRVGAKRQKRLSDPQAVGFKTAQLAEMAGELEEVMEHPALDVLRKPNQWQLGSELFHRHFYSMELTGNRFWHIVVPRGGPERIELYPMAPQWTRVVPDENDLVGGYVYGRNGVTEAMFQTDEVLHQRFYPSEVNPYYGVGPMAAVIGEADLDAAQLRSELALWNNHARPDWVLPLDPEMAWVDAAAIEARLESKFRGPANRGRFLVTTSGEPKPLQWSPREMEYILGLQNIERRILAAFGVPESEVRLNDANLASSTTGNIQYMRQTVKPRCVLLQEYLTEFLLPFFGVAPGEMMFVYDEIVPQDKAATALWVSSLKNARIITPNEARSEIGFDPMEGMDEVDEPPTLGSFGGGEGKPDADAEDEETGEKQEKSANKPPLACSCGDGGCAEVRAATPPSVARKDIAFSVETAFALFGDRAIDTILRVFNRFLPDLVMRQNEVSEEEFVKAMDAAIDSFSFPVMQFGYTGAVQEARTLPRLPSSVQVGLGVIPESAIQALRERNLRIAGDVTGTTSERIKVKLEDALREGYTRPEAARVVMDAMGTENAVRADLIAQTEISRAHAHGKITTWRQMGVERAEWVLSVNPCPLCQAAKPVFDAKNASVGIISERILNGGYATAADPAPPQHPNCQCDLRPIYPQEWTR